MSFNASSLPFLGAGLGYRDALCGQIFLHQQAIDFLEIIAEHYFDATPEKFRECDLLTQHFTVIPHGINLSIGSAEGLDEKHLDQWTTLIERIHPPWWSEHLALTHAGGIDIGHLSPLPFTHEAVDVVCRNIEKIKQFISTPLLLENITYLIHLPGAQMTEAEFISAILRETDCGLLLDLTNLYTNAINFHQDPASFLDQIPLERVVQLHFVGGYWNRDVLIDSHSHATPPEVWNLIQNLSARTSVKGMILERDENFPEFSALLQELQCARQFCTRKTVSNEPSHSL